MRSASHAYRVTYIRRGWKHPRSRHFRDRNAAFRLVEKLTTPTWDLAPLIEVTVDRQELGPVELVWELKR